MDSRKNKSGSRSSLNANDTGSSGPVNDPKSVVEAPVPLTMKAWLASIPPEDRRREHFENYVFFQERRKLRKRVSKIFLIT